MSELSFESSWPTSSSAGLLFFTLKCITESRPRKAVAGEAGGAVEGVEM